MRAHTVILGAGASVATIPNGDKNGRKSSIMNGLIEKLGLDDIIKGVELKTTSNNLEDIYSELYEREECKEIVNELERRIYHYFESLEIPDNPTIYDLLILSLTKKDLIATFNWDPLLLQAYVRCVRFTDNLPTICCLHGNVSMGYCMKHAEYGMTDAICPVCGKKLPPTRLLFPVTQKNYSEDEYIKKCWEATEYMIENSSTITIFGYSAPSSDKEAVDLLKKAWGDLEERQLEEVSVIDIISEEEMLSKWQKFIYSHHYRYTKDFYNSYLGMFPRRSCEMIFATYQLNVWPDTKSGFWEGMSWDDIDEMMEELIAEEERTPIDKNYPLHYVNRKMFD